ncbi:MAG: glycine--tRNA ligase subunit beta [Candidatus Calescibacterium sp.]|nr:glycine--tRNA ligase subunit beta [Candidatus Calescibacterium sp.]MCX7972343.1 glycine--tRNA ligase subunit beta [bacterium]MDW8195936.1 glycine--tRNA ligase subunit beta [Candidatus Calescibacterium sp.]
MKDILIEIGTEDLPASKCKDILEQLQRNVPITLRNNRVVYKSIDYELTPRRIVVKIYKASEYQIPETIEKRGPSTTVAFDNQGNPTKELLGFLKANNSSLDNIKIKKINDKEYVFITVEKETKNIREILKEIISSIIKELKFEKPMYWITKDFQFIRPIRWILCLLDNECIEIEYLRTENKSYKSSNYTYGHRIFYPKRIRIKSIETYNEQLREAMVITNPKTRENLIKDSISRIEIENNVKAKLDPKLLEKLVFMYEYPVAVLSEFEEKYLNLPEELIITVLTEQQKFVPLLDNEVLSNKFIAFKEGEVVDVEVNRYNYKKVVEARLEDALHLLNEDRKVLLASRVSKLKDILYYENLGTLYDKTIRIKAITEYICQSLNLDNKITEFALRAATLSKADRTTNIVFEYPNLQGTIGKYLALEQGENEVVANAIYDHYLPETPEDNRYPTRYEGIVLSIADRIDTVVSFISIGNIIKGSSDIIGLRRTLSTLINIIHNFKLSLDLEELIKFCYSILADKKYGIEIHPKVGVNRIIREIKEFFYNRVEEIYKQESFSYDKIRSVLHIFWKDYNLAHNNLTYIADKNNEEIKEIVLLSKRLKNIVFNDFLKKQDTDDSLFPYNFEEFDNIDIIDFPSNIDLVKVNKSLLSSDQEIKLFEFIENNQDIFIQKIRHDIDEAFKMIQELSHLIQEYFEKVFVMVEDRNIRLNRVLLLYKTFLLTVNFADFSKIVVSQ